MGVLPPCPICGSLTFEAKKVNIARFNESPVLVSCSHPSHDTIVWAETMNFDPVNY